MQTVIQGSYFLTAFLFILGLKRMSSPKTARSGILWAGAAMGLAIIVTFFIPGLKNFELMIIAIFLGGGFAWFWAKKVPMTDMPQMIAIYNGMGGGAAGIIAIMELMKNHIPNAGLMGLAVAGGLIGSVAFSGSVIAFLKLQRLMRDRPYVFSGQKILNIALLLAALVCGVLLFFDFPSTVLWLFFSLSFIFGVSMTLPIGGGDMPVVISLYNALTGLAVGFEGFAMGNAAMIVAGTVVGAAGTLLTLMMARAMNRSLANVLFGGFGQVLEDQSEQNIQGSLKSMSIEDAAIQMAYADRVLVVPGYGMAVAQAQHKVKEMADLLEKRGVNVRYAIHPVAGRMPGHMNVLLAEASIPYEKLLDLEEINPEFPSVDVSLVIGANDVVNPAARTNKASPIYGMPILNVDKSKNVLVVKRGKGKGFAGVENELFFADNTHMVYGDAQTVVNQIAQSLKQL